MSDDVDKVVSFPGVTYHDLPPDQVLDGAKGKLRAAVVIGWDQDDNLYAAASTADAYETLWLLEAAKRRLFEVA